MFRKLPDFYQQPYWIKALHPQQFQLIDNEIKYCWNSSQPIMQNSQPVSHAYRHLFQNAFDAWSTISNITFVESDLDCKVALFEMNNPWDWEKPVSLGMTRWIFNYTQIFINSYFASIASPARRFKTIAHEIGHSLWLEHGFSPPNAYPQQIFLQKSEESIIFSIMNYDVPIDPSGLRVVPTTPMPYDIATVQYVYGKNLKTNAGDTIYFLPNLRPSLVQKYWYGEKPISAIWDAGGTDTLSFMGQNSDITINLNEGPDELTNIAGDAFLNLALGSNIENVIGGKGKNKIILNKLDNIIDIRDSIKSTIITTKNGSGTDILLGFKPEQGDKIIFESPMSNITFNASLPMHISIAGETIEANAGTKIVFSDNHQIILPGVNPVQSQDYFLVQNDNKVKPPDIISPKFHLQTDPNTLFHFSKKHFMPTASVSYAVTLSEEIIKMLAKKHLTTETIDHTIALLRFLLSCYLYDGICTPMIALVIDKTLQHLTGKSTKPVLDALLYISSFLVVNAKPQQIAISVAKATGYVCGHWAAKATMKGLSCVYGFWKKRKSDLPVENHKFHKK